MPTITETQIKDTAGRGDGLEAGGRKAGARLELQGLRCCDGFRGTGRSMRWPREWGTIPILMCVITRSGWG